MLFRSDATHRARSVVTSAPRQLGRLRIALHPIGHGYSHEGVKYVIEVTTSRRAPGSRPGFWALTWAEEYSPCRPLGLLFTIADCPLRFDLTWDLYSGTTRNSQIAPGAQPEQAVRKILSSPVMLLIPRNSMVPAQI